MALRQRVISVASKAMRFETEALNNARHDVSTLEFGNAGPGEHPVRLPRRRPAAIRSALFTNFDYVTNFTLQV